MVTTEKKVTTGVVEEAHNKENDKAANITNVLLWEAEWVPLGSPENCNFLQEKIRRSVWLENIIAKMSGVNTLVKFSGELEILFIFLENEFSEEFWDEIFVFFYSQMSPKVVEAWEYACGWFC